jgi:serine/threonine-protein kinase
MARYELLERIGVGGMAEIFRGKAIASGGFEKPVAIKRILPHLGQDVRFVELLITEAKTLSQLRHRNIVQIYDVGLGDDAKYFLVMEYVDGIDLGALFESLEKRARRLPPDVALHIAAEVCEALDHAHRARGTDGEPLGLVHRDVSPSNVLLSCSGEVKLTDFGIAKRTEEATGHGGVRGKFAYISPEQAHNVHVDGRSDVYSIGIVLYELLTGQRLYSALPDFDALRAVREGRAPRPREAHPDLSPELETLLLRALAPRPEDRFPSAGNFGARLRGYRYSLETTAGDPAVEIARLVEEHQARRSGSPLSRESTYVRIATVDGFSGGFELGEESTGGSGLLGEVTHPISVDLDNETTRAVKIGAPALRRDSELALDETSPPMDELAPHISRPQRHLRADSGPTGEFDLSDAATSVVDYRRPRALLARPLPGGATRLPPVTGAASAPPNATTRPIAAISPPSAGSAMARPRAASSAASLAVAKPHDPGERRRPAVDAGGFSTRRRLILIAGMAAAILALAAFVVAGVVTRSDESPAAAPLPPDAAPPPDAAVTMTMPPDQLEPKPEKPRKKKQRPRKKKPPDKAKARKKTGAKSGAKTSPKRRTGTKR